MCSCVNAEISFSLLYVKQSQPLATRAFDQNGQLEQRDKELVGLVVFGRPFRPRNGFVFYNGFGRVIYIVLASCAPGNINPLLIWDWVSHLRLACASPSCCCCFHVSYMLGYKMEKQTLTTFPALVRPLSYSRYPTSIITASVCIQIEFSQPPCFYRVA